MLYLSERLPVVISVGLRWMVASACILSAEKVMEVAEASQPAAHDQHS